MAHEHEHEHEFDEHEEHDHIIDFSESMSDISLNDDADTASQRSLSLHDTHNIVDSPSEPRQRLPDAYHPLSPTHDTAQVEPTPPSPILPPKPVSPTSKEIEPSFTSSRASVAPSLASTLLSEPDSVTSVTSSVSIAKKIRPESILIDTHGSRLILGLAVVDFNHIVSVRSEEQASSISFSCFNDVWYWTLRTTRSGYSTLKVGPTVEMAYPPSILEDEELCKILPFLALPDGAHLVSLAVLYLAFLTRLTRD